MGEEPSGGRVGTGQTSGRSRTVPDFRSLLPRTMAGTKGRPDAGGWSRARLSGQASHRAPAQEGDQKAGMWSVVTGQSSDVRRFRYAFIHTHKPVMDDAPFRAFNTTADYRLLV